MIFDNLENLEDLTPGDKGDCTVKHYPPKQNGVADATPQDLRAPEFSDESLALLFAECNSSSMRYVAALGKWFVWDEKQWRIDDTLMARDRSRKICREASVQCNQPKVSKTVASAKTVSAVERLAQSDRRLAATVDQWDADPWSLNTPDGVIDLKSGERRDHSPTDYLTKITGVAPDSSCPITTWLAFLTRVTDGNTELIGYLQRVVGYSLTGSTKEHALFFLYGLGANGKTTFLNAIMACTGDYHRSAPIETFTASNQDRHPTDLAGLRGARLVTAIETEEGRRWAESRIKALTGGDKISARFMRQDFFEYTPQFKLIIAGNHKPGLRSVDEAIRRRFNLIPFTVTIPPEERDENLPDKLKAELPGILAWIVEGCVDWQQRGLAAPAVVAEATAAYLESEDALAAWMDECAERDPNAWEKSSTLFVSWNEWATKSGEYVGSEKSFRGKLENHNVTPARNKKARGFRGLKLVTAGYGDQ
jgi:putative DNA primase/helicase